MTGHSDPPLVTVIPEALDGERLDRVVAVLTGATRARAGELVSNGAVLVNDVVVVQRSRRVRVGDAVSAPVDDAIAPRALEPDPSVMFDVVFADDDVIVVNKPAGLVVHPGSGNQRSTLVHGVLARFPDVGALAVGEQAFRPGIVHRLDKGTSGLMMVARTGAAVDSLIAQLQARTVSRRYLALVHGTMAAKAGVIDAPVGRSDHDPTKMTVSASGRVAVTHYATRSTYTKPDPCVLLECRLETGRTHQIRVHLSAIGHPIVGDARYGSSRHDVSSPRPWLHAFELRFDHPRTGESMVFGADVPEDLELVLSALS